jgi:putative ABC transport system permease protein
LLQFLMESIILSIIGGLAGIVLGVGGSFLVSKFAGWLVVVTYSAVSLSFAFSASVGILFGFWPARRASLLSPIEALRYE